MSPNDGWVRKVKGRAVTKTSHSQPLQRAALQPWLRDHYAALRAETGPRWRQTRAVVVPVIADTSHKVRDEWMPAAAHLSAHLAEEAAHRSAPLRAEVSDRAAATLAAARGQLSAAQIGQLNRRHNHRKLWIIGAAAAVGAALGTAAVLWQRSRYQAWVEDEAVHDAIAETPAPDHPDTDNHNHHDHHDDNDASDPNNTDNDADAHASSTGRHRDEQQ